MRLIYTIFYFSDNTYIHEYYPEYLIAYNLAKYTEKYKDAHIVYSAAYYTSDQTNINPSICNITYRNTNHDEIPLRIAQGMMRILN